MDGSARRLGGVPWDGRGSPTGVPGSLGEEGSEARVWYLAARWRRASSSSARALSSWRAAAAASASASARPRSASSTCRLSFFSGPHHEDIPHARFQWTTS
eukprot:5304694-Pyramimonas_sp.AAC.1